jgi:hypothetical protein
MKTVLNQIFHSYLGFLICSFLKVADNNIDPGRMDTTRSNSIMPTSHIVDDLFSSSCLFESKL